MDQILLEIPEGKERKVAILLLDMIEPSGWINIDLESFSVNNNLDFELVKKTLNKLQKLEPTGVFATNLGECLRIQLKEKKLLNIASQKLTENCSNFIACLSCGRNKKIM
jgi:RNA polymerase sigma-54 factor